LTDQEETMSSRSVEERRLAPRKNLSVPVQLRVTVADTSPDSLSGEMVNYSDRGVYFTTTRLLNVGDRLEMSFAIPREVSGRNAENVQCAGRVVHVHPAAAKNGRTGIGALVERWDRGGGSRWPS
jgi:Tfp pilus assembly protein PilZ